MSPDPRRPPGQTPRARRPRRAGVRGLAMIAVLLVLIALFVLCAPFLLSAGNADRASSELADRAGTRIALDAAERHARAMLGSSHLAIDRTPYADSEEELLVGNRFPAGFLDANDARGVMWDLDATDVAGSIDLNSAPPQVIGNLLGCTARLTELATEKSEKLTVNSSAGFLSEGVLLVSALDAGRELVGYAASDGTTFQRLARGLGVRKDADDRPLGCGPQPAHGHEVGSFVLDQRAFAIPLWRAARARHGQLAALDAIEQAAEAAPFAMSGTLGPEAFTVLARTTSVHAGVGTGARWGHPARVLDEPERKPEHGCVLKLDDSRTFNAGTTVRISDGTATEFGLVIDARPGSILLVEPLANAFHALRTVVAPLVRAPVDVNTASPEVLKALFWNLKLRDKNARITSQEADQLVEVVVGSRPFQGLEDFLRRVVLPAGGLEALPADAPRVPELFRKLAQTGALAADGGRAVAGFLDPEDAVALYKNALDANDGELEFSTMPLTFVSRDVYRLDLRAALNAPSGVQRATGAREVVEHVVPQRELLRVWARQEDFDEELRLHASAPGWLTGPEATYRYDRLYQSACPTRARAHLGPDDTLKPEDPAPPEGTTPVHTFPARDDAAFAQLAPARTDEEGRQGRVLHFDDETRDVEGHDLADGPLVLATGDAHVGWGNGDSLAPFSFEMWIEPRALEDGAIFLDAGGNFTDSDRVTLLLENGDLVLRVLDGAGDQPLTDFHERSEIRYPIAGTGPGLPADAWSHVELAVQGNRPDQMRLLVDGRAGARTPGLTRLTAALQPDTDRISVESTEGFPERCTLRIGYELIEAVRDGEKGFTARFSSSGDAAGFGGRLARERFDFSGTQAEVNMGLSKDTSYAEGTAVELYGYSQPLYSNVPATGGALAADLGPFGVARATGIVKGGKEKLGNQAEPIDLKTTSGDTIPYGYGMDGVGDDVEALVLESADGARGAAETMRAFSSAGGYAALLSIRWKQPVQDRFGQVELVDRDKDGTRLGGVEVIRYSGVQGNHLLIAARGDRLSELANLKGADPDLVAGRGSFVFKWISDLAERDEKLTRQVLVVPISLPVRGAGGITSFLPARAGASEFAQITHVGAESDLTEWVRYDEITTDGLVRDDPTALLDLNLAAHGGLDRSGEGEDPLHPLPPGPGGGPVKPGGPGPGRPGGGAQSFALTASPGAGAPESAPASALANAAGRATPAAQQSLNYWNYALGQAQVEVEAYPVTRAVSSQFQFRGVLGTFSHEHSAGASVLPVWKIRDVDETAGLPGRFDAVTFLDPDPEQPGYPGIVQHAHRPFDYWQHSYDDGGAPLTAEAGTSTALSQKSFDTGLIYVALDRPVGVPIPASVLPSPPAGDTRAYARVTLFPSGERPRRVGTVSIGADQRNPKSGVPRATIDEVVFGTDLLDYQFVVGEKGFAEGAQDLPVMPLVRTLGGDFSNPAPLGDLPEDAGLLRIGSEILCYDSYDAGANTLHVPPQGRGLLGTEARNHAQGTAIRYLESWRVSVLNAGLGAGDAELRLSSTAGFPSAGTLLVDDELVHYTHLRGTALLMPRASEVPGAMDAKGPGLFRGRYGTTPAGHASGAPVILFPFRYWDRWADRADAPELSYFEFTLDQPCAFWRRSFWQGEDPPFAGPRLEVLERRRPDAPWDTDPAVDDALEVQDQGHLDRGGNPIGQQSDGLAWRAYVRYLPGSFDPREGLAHGWKTTPRLRLLGAEYLAPNRVLSRVDR